MTETFYDLLGVPEDASKGAIEDAYREQIKQVHPDVSDDADAGERTKRLNRAKRVLTDERERARYDREGHETYTSDGSTDPASGPAREANGRSAGAGSDRQRRRRDGHTRAGRATRPGSRRAAGNATRSGSVADSGDPWPGRDRRRGSRQGSSAGSTGPSWQSSRSEQAAEGGATAADGPSARRQSAAGTTSGSHTDWSWNAWEQTRSWAVRQGRSDSSGLDPEQFVPTEQSVLLVVSSFLLYPFFIASVLVPLFPMVARLLVATCTLLLFAYLLSVPGIAVTVFGLWSVLAPVALVALPGVSLFSVAGVVALSVTWVPCGLAVLTFSMLET
jgi:curved DNA-binding protein CbpA